MEIHIYNDEPLISWGVGEPIWWLSKDGTVAEAPRVQGNLIWSSGQPGFDQGYAVGSEDGYRECLRDLDEAS